MIPALIAYIALPHLCKTDEESYRVHAHLELQRAASTEITMRFNTLFFLLVISCVCLAFAQVAYDDCCLKYVRKMTLSTQKRAVDYRRQVTDGGCNIPAIIFKMKRGRELCANPRENWVLGLMDKIDTKKLHSKKFHKKTTRRLYSG